MTRKHRQTGDPCEHWQTTRWYSTLESALQDVAQLRLRISEEEDIGLALAEVNGWLAGIRQTLADFLSVEGKT